MERKTALITGASSGIGMEFAKALMTDKKVTDFILVARRAERLEALKEELLSCGAESAAVISADLTTGGGIDAVSDYVKTQNVSVHYLINAAGFGVFGTYAEVSEKDTAAMIDCNVKAVVLLTHRILPFMPENSHIILLGSASCFTALPGFNIYASTKAFILHYAKALRYEVLPKGIYVTCLCPGWVNTEFLGKAEKTGIAYPATYKPMLEPADVVKKCLAAAEKKKFYCVTNWYTKLQHLLSKICPSDCLTKTWMGMLKKH